MTYTPAQLRRLDAWIAENVMGITLSDGNPCGRCGGEGEYPQCGHGREGRRTRPTMKPCPACHSTKRIGVVRAARYTTDLLAAFEVKDEIIAGRHVRFKLTEGSHMLPYAEFFDVQTGHERFGASAETISLAICIAAIRAKGGDVEKIAGGAE